ncbi:baseplate J/gp47 family protein [Belliella marina]|uniref:Baseplate J/gp47 family protein n=1 Tax=Belliella marina TaxID=1644146 RepID=A0ABW4VN49_9BACT
MSKSDEKILSILKRNGSSQESRFNKSLDPSQLQLMEFGEEDWVLFAYNFAQKLKFFNLSNKAEGTWDEFFKELDLDASQLSFENQFELQSIKGELGNVLTAYGKNSELSPHLTLFISFLRVLDITKSKFNLLTKRHLDFYYREVLQMDKLPPSADSVYVVLELAKNAQNQRIETQTLFNAGKNENGSPLLYSNSDEISINTINVKAIMNIFHDQAKNKVRQNMLLDPNDGESQTLENKESWWPFGHSLENDPQSTDAEFGFVISSNVLLAKEGRRKITFDFTFGNDIPFGKDEFRKFTSIYLSTAKEWLELDEVSIQDIKIQNAKLIVTILLDTSLPPIEYFKTEDPSFNLANPFPSAKFMSHIDEDQGYQVFDFLSNNSLQKLRIDIDVSEVKNINLENDQTTINAQKPFYPFSTRPFKGSSFSFSYPEAFSKNCSEVKLNFEWKNTPDSFKEHYETYILEAKKNISSNYLIELQSFSYLQNAEIIGKLKENLSIGENVVLRASKESNPPARKATTSQTSAQSTSPIVSGDDYFRYKSELLLNGIKIKNLNTVNNRVFEEENDTFKFKFQVNNQINQVPTASIRVNLQQSFLHDIYPKIYAMVLTSEKDDKILPNEPYTPLAADLSLSYKGSVEFGQNNESNRIIHLHPFGFGRQDNPSLISRQYEKDGYLYIGLEKTNPNDIVSLLFQFADGTENPLSVDGEPIKWSILKGNTWEVIPKASILLNETLNFLRSGIVKIQLPPSIDTNNTVFPEGLAWIRVKLDGKYDAVCQCINIHAQALRLEARDASLATHLPGQLPADTISKLERRISQIKSVAQPYPSFGGKGKETDLNYYRRVSERLRHKNRAVTQWDYEHLILEEFPELISVKCLNHTNSISFNAPGHVTLVVVPQVRQINPDTLVYPRVSSAKLEEIKDYISSYISPSIEVHVINPEYEFLQIQVDIQVVTGLDFNFYQNQLKKDITNFLSPWAFQEQTLLNFNKEFHKSQIVYFIENLHYIDYISKLELRLDKTPIQNKVIPTSPKNIIVSDQIHIVNLAKNQCAKA